MTDSEQRALVLIGSSQEWSARSLESVFSRDEYEVRRYESGRDVIAHAPGADLVVLDQNLKGIDALAVCRALSENERIGPTTPIVMVTASATIERAERVLALDAGAWDVISLAVDGDMLVLRLRNFLLAKR